jgi:hypothetical protein
MAVGSWRASATTARPVRHRTRLLHLAIPMPRIYSEELYELPRVEVLDWQLWERLDQLVQEHVPPDYHMPLYFVNDERGQYDATSLEALRADVEQQERPPDTIRLTLSTSHGGQYFVNVYISSVIGSGGQVQSDHEAFVMAEPLNPDVPVRLTSSRWRAFLYDPWTIGIGTALVVAAILALLALMFR